MRKKILIMVIVIMHHLLLFIYFEGNRSSLVITVPGNRIPVSGEEEGKIMYCTPIVLKIRFISAAPERGGASWK